MKPRRVITPQDAYDVFDQAVRDHSLAVLSIQEGADWQTVKCRFLERDPNGRFFVLDYQPVNGDMPSALIPGQCVGISFRYRSRKVLFASVVEARGRFQVNNETSIPAVRFRWPDAITELQRRAYYRTPIPKDMSLLVNLLKTVRQGYVLSPLMPAKKTKRSFFAMASQH